MLVPIDDLDFNDSDSDTTDTHEVLHLDFVDLPTHCIRRILICANTMDTRLVCTDWRDVWPDKALSALITNQHKDAIEPWIDNHPTPRQEYLDNALVCAARLGDTVITERLLDIGASADACASSAFTTAAMLGFVATADVLLLAMSIPQETLRMGNFAIVHAVAHTGNLAMTQHLFAWLSETARTDCLMGRRRLFLDALEGGNADIAKLLIYASGARHSCTQTLRLFPLDSVIKQNHIGIVRLILELIPMPQHEQRSMDAEVLYRGAALGNHEVVLFVVDHAKNTHTAISSDEFLALRIAAHKGHTAIIRTILGRAADITEAIRAVSDSPVRFAARGGHLAALQFLLDEVKEPRKSVRAMGNFALRWALQNEHRAVARQLVKIGEYRPFEIETIQNDIEKAKRALQRFVVPTRSPGIEKMKKKKIQRKKVKI
jgi:hypothetical protein